MTESELVRVITDYLRIKHIFFTRLNTGATKIGDRFIKFGSKGWPDIIGLLNGGKFFGIECKAGKNKPSPEQTQVLKEINDRGGIGILAYSLDDVINNLK